MTTATCHGPDCDRPARAGKLCPAHYQQRRRGQEQLRPLRGTTQSLVNVGVRVTAPTRERVLADAAGARTALERWARRR